MTRNYVQDTFRTFSDNVILRDNMTTIHQHKLTSKQLLTILFTSSSTMKSVTERIQNITEAAGNSSRKNNQVTGALYGTSTRAFSTASKITRLTTTTALNSMEKGLANKHSVKAITLQEVLPRCPKTPPGLQVRDYSFCRCLSRVLRKIFLPSSANTIGKTVRSKTTMNK